MAELLEECATFSPPCSVVLPTVTGAMLETGNFDGDSDFDIAAYIQAAPSLSGTEGTLVYLEVGASGLQIQRRHDGLGGGAVDLAVADFDGDFIQDSALLFDSEVRIVRSCAGCSSWPFTGDLKEAVAFATNDFDEDGDTDLIVLSRGVGDPATSAKLGLLRNTGTGLTLAGSFGFRVGSQDVLTDVVAEPLFDGSDTIVIVISAEQANEGRVYWFPVTPTSLVPLHEDPVVVTFEGGARRLNRERRRGSSAGPT